MPKGDVETYWQDGEWHNRVEGTEQVLSSERTKAEAVDIGRDIARELRVEHIIKSQDGRIATRNSYGDDPRTIRG